MIGKAAQAAQSTKQKQKKNAKQAAKNVEGGGGEEEGEVKSNCFFGLSKNCRSLRML